MAELILEPTFESLHGKLSKNSDIIYRRKAAYNRSGNAMYRCVQEAYVISRPRDYKKNPPKGAELAMLQRFTEACRLTKEQLSDPETQALWQQRFEAQQRTPDADAPRDPRTGKRKKYGTLWNYTRATILRQLQAAAMPTDGESLQQ